MPQPTSDTPPEHTARPHAAAGGTMAGARWRHRMELPTAAAMVAFGRHLAAHLRPGDLVVLTGDLGAGKTTLTQGIGEGLGVRGRIASPTFIIARTHASATDGPPLVHVDAYRLHSLAEVDDLDLDTTLDQAVTVVEWGAGLVEGLSDDRLEITLHRARGAGGDIGDQPRQVTISGYGHRWTGCRGADLAGPADQTTGPAGPERAADDGEEEP